MPVVFSLDRSQRVVFTHATDDVTMPELIAHSDALRACFASGEIDGTWAQVSDFREVTHANGVSAQDIRELADINPFPPEVPRVMIAPFSVVFGLGRMYELLAECNGDHNAIVRTTEEATQWMAERGRAIDLTLV